jgi:DNA primase
MFSARDFGLTVQGRSGSEELCLCPWHSDSNPSAWFNKKKGLLYCSVCNRGANWQQLAKEFGVKGGGWEESETTFDPYHGEVKEEEFVLNLFDDFDELRLYGEKRYHSYLESRQVSLEAAEKFKLEVTRNSYGEQILFPVCDMAGDRIGCLLRSIFPFGTRYTKLGRITPLWPLEQLRQVEEGEIIVVVEGAFSALRIATVWPELHVFSLFGARVPKGLADLLDPFRPLVIYDYDQAGKAAANKLANQTTDRWTIRLWHTSPDDMPDDELIEELTDSLTFIKP